MKMEATDSGWASAPTLAAEELVVAVRVLGDAKCDRVECKVGRERLAVLERRALHPRMVRNCDKLNEVDEDTEQRDDQKHPVETLEIHIVERPFR